MSFNIAALLPDVTEKTGNTKLEDSIDGQRGLSREISCSCDICSFAKMREPERNLAPGLSMPHLSWMPRSSPFQTDALLAPRTGHEQPYWYRPSYFGWQYVSSASHVTHQSTLLQLETASSAEFQFARYHATGYHANGCHATGYHSSASENRIARGLGGLAYDHGEFPKIVSVHSMADSHNAMQDYPDDSDNSNPPASVETEPNAACPLPGPPITAVSLCSENSTRESNEYAGKPLEYEICGNIDSGSQSSPVRDDGHVKPRTDGISHEVNNAAFSRRPGDHKVEMEWPAYATAEECKSSDAENNEVLDSDPNSSDRTGGDSNSAVPESDNGVKLSTVEKTREELVRAKKKTLIRRRIQKIKNIQRSLSSLKRKQSQHKKAVLLREMAVLKKEIEHLSNGSPIDSLSKTVNNQEGSPFNSTPVKMTPSAPNKEMMAGTRVAVQTSTRVQKSSLEKTEINVVSINNATMGDSFSSDRPDGKFSGFRMNVFEKLGLLSEQNKLCAVPNSSAADGPSKDSQTSQIKASDENVSEIVSVGKDERCVPQFSLVYSEDSQESKENGQILVKSARTNVAEEALGYSSAANVNIKKLALHSELPNSWSSAYVSDNQRELKKSRDVQERKQLDEDVLQDEPTAKRRCKTFPRKVVRKNDSGTEFVANGGDLLDKSPLQGQENNEIALQWENFSTESEVSGEAENGNSNRLATEDNGNVDNNDNSDVNRSNEAGSEFIPPRVYDDDTLQRKLELRESKICDLIRKQEGLLQTIEKMSSKPLPKDKSRLILDGDLHCGQLKGF